jgi:hypothetical protein
MGRNQASSSSANSPVGMRGRVTATIRPGHVGEVMISIRGGAEAFHAQAVYPDEIIEKNTQVLVMEYFPPRTVCVTKLM